jgi:two-component system, NarL family, nitrate/nitrite response regulator NarL
MTTKIKIAIVDDHELLRRGLRETLAEYPEFEVVGEGGNVEEALQLATNFKPDIMLVDINMPGNGIAVVKLLNSFEQRPKVIMLTVYENMANVRDTMSNGAYGYILKGVAGDELIAIIRSVSEGKKYVSPELAARLLSEARQSESGQSQDASQQISNLSTLTEREMQIFELIGLGTSNQDISKKLQLSEATIKHYITPLFRKLGVKNRTEAAIKANSSR